MNHTTPDGTRYKAVPIDVTEPHFQWYAIHRCLEDYGFTESPVVLLPNISGDITQEINAWHAADLRRIANALD